MAGSVAVSGLNLKSPIAWYKTQCGTTCEHELCSFAEVDSPKNLVWSPTTPLLVDHQVLAQFQDSFL